MSFTLCDRLMRQALSHNMGDQQSVAQLRSYAALSTKLIFKTSDGVGNFQNIAWLAFWLPPVLAGIVFPP